MVSEELRDIAPAEASVRGVILDTGQVRARGWHLSIEHPGVSYKVLWQDPDGRSMAGLMTLTPGSRVPRHAHQGAAHDLWVSEGSCSIGGHSLVAGAYQHVPPGAPHAIDAVGSDGCVLFFLYVRSPADRIAVERAAA
jgi:quercetin dioxygenase-like cupin family protein